MKTSNSGSEDIPADVVAEAQRLARGAEILPEGVQALTRKLQEARSEGRVLRVKLGVDPTSSDLHLGHSVVLRALRRFQDAGHQAVLILGGFTAQIGDPSGRNKTRPSLTAQEVAGNAATFLAQVGTILDVSKLEVRNNADWLATMDLTAVLKLASQATVNQMLAKDGFGTRLEQNQPIGLHELFYPLLQGFDSVAVAADIEIGGSDQRFNVLAGRQMQINAGQKPQVVMLLPLLVGVDGVRKMSKTFGNSIGLKDEADDIFAKTMRIPDGLIVGFFELATVVPDEELAQVRAQLAGNGNPRDAKEKLAHQLVLQIQGETAANQARDNWRKVHSQRQLPDDMPSHVLSAPAALCQLLVELKLSDSKTKARKLVEGGGVRLDGQKVADPNHSVPVPPAGGAVLQVGRRNFVRLVPPAVN